MTVRKPRYANEEFARRGMDWYERQVRQRVEGGNDGKIVGIDVDTGDFEIAEDTLAAAERLLTRRPEAQIWFVRVGHQGVHRFGTRNWLSPDPFITLPRCSGNSRAMDRPHHRRA
jgi:hypothetical protein